MKWEYLVFKNSSLSTAILSDYGENCWELVSVVYNDTILTWTCVFKRPLEE